LFAVDNDAQESALRRKLESKLDDLVKGVKQSRMAHLATVNNEDRHHANVNVDHKATVEAVEEAIGTPPSTTSKSVAGVDVHAAAAQHASRAAAVAAAAATAAPPPTPAPTQAKASASMNVRKRQAKAAPLRAPMPTVSQDSVNRARDMAAK
jgi:hypothetical protein